MNAAFFVSSFCCRLDPQWLRNSSPLTFLLPPSPSPPGRQGGPHNHTISALAVALKQANTEEFRTYQEQVGANCKALCKRLQVRGGAQGGGWGQKRGGGNCKVWC